MAIIPVDILQWRQEIDNRIANNEYETKLLTLKSIETSSATQSRAQLDAPTLDRYTELWQQKANFPPVLVFSDGGKYWLTDGYHRYHAKNNVDKFSSILATIIPGTIDDAILYSLGVNSAHGLPRKDRDVNYSVITLLGNPIWIKYSNVQCGVLCGCSESLIRRIKGELLAINPALDSELADLTHKRGVSKEDIKKAHANLIAHITAAEGVVVSKKGTEMKTTKIGTSAKPKPQFLYVGTSSELVLGANYSIDRISLNNPVNVIVEGKSIPKSHLILADSSDDAIRESLLANCEFKLGDKVRSLETNHVGIVMDIIPCVDPPSQMWRLRLRVFCEPDFFLDDDAATFVPDEDLAFFLDDPANFVSDEDAAIQLNLCEVESEALPETERVFGAYNPYLDRKQLLFLGRGC